mgnify:CR=1 FL=1
MKLYNFFRSGTSHRLRIALNLKGVSTEYIAVDLRVEEHLKEAFKSLNPQGLVPALAVNDAQVLIQSPAIIEWLEETYPTPALLPTDANDRAHVFHSWSAQGLINPIVISRDNVLVAGERRLTACKQLGWTAIPAQFLDELSEFELSVIELEENVRRSDLTWQDECAAVLKYHELQSANDANWNREATAQALGFSLTSVNKSILVASALDNPRVAEADKFSAAYGIVSRERERKINSTLAEVDAVFDTPVPAAPGEPAVVAPPKAKVVPLLNVDFKEWELVGPKINMLHCDFPYGIELHKSGQAAGTAFATYDDSEDVYFDLLSVLESRMNSLVAESAHMIFWFPMMFYSETMQRLQRMGWDVQYTPLVWFKSDNTGIMPDHRRQPRRVYETAFFCSRGDRHLAVGPHGQGAVANAFAFPGGVKTVHMNEKPVEMLRHFMRLCVDEYSVVLDPTCGSGNAIKAALSLGANSALGLEINEELYTNAVAAF